MNFYRKLHLKRWKSFKNPPNLKMHFPTFIYFSTLEMLVLCVIEVSQHPRSSYHTVTFLVRWGLSGAGARAEFHTHLSGPNNPSRDLHGFLSWSLLLQDLTDDNRDLGFLPPSCPQPEPSGRIPQSLGYKNASPGLSGLLRESSPIRAKKSFTHS